MRGTCPGARPRRGAPGSVVVVTLPFPGMPVWREDQARGGLRSFVSSLVGQEVVSGPFHPGQDPFPSPPCTAESEPWASLRFRYQPPNLAISTLYWKAWPLLLVVAAFNPENIGEPPLPGGLAVVPAGCCSLFLSGRRAGDL